MEGSWLAFLGYSWTLCILTLLALAEFVGDQLPSTASRTVSMQFGARLLSGAMCGAAIGSPHGAMLGGLLAGIVGAVIGTSLDTRSVCAWPRRSRRIGPPLSSKTPSLSAARS